MPHAAWAHAFDGDAVGYIAFLDGNAAIFSDIGIVLLLVGLALIIGRANRFSAVTGFAALLIGAAVGLAASFGLGGSAAIVSLAGAVAIGIWGAWSPDAGRNVIIALCLVTGILTSIGAYAGHGNDAIHPLTHVGSFFAAWLLAATASGMVKTAADRIALPWLPIAMRALSSWVAAIAVMVLAFVTTNQI